jgi:hypothetical protein
MLSHFPVSTLLAENSDSVVILRLGNEEAERVLFGRRWLFVGLQRGWRKGSKVLFARKSDFIFGSGLVSAVQPTDELDQTEQELSLQRNWSAKLHFATLARFNPPVPIKMTPLASQNPIGIHGSQVSQELAAKIEELATIKIIT